MSLHALLARAEEHKLAAERDTAECTEALAQLKVMTDKRRKDIGYFNGVAVRTRGLIAYLNEGTDEQRATLHSVNPFVIDPEEVEAIFKGREIDPGPAEEDDRAEPWQPRAPVETFDDPEIAPPPAPESPADAEPLTASDDSVVEPPAAGRTFNDRVLAEIVRARQPNGYASVELARLRQTLHAGPSRISTALAALANAGRIQRVRAGAGAEPGWATFKVLEAAEQAA